MTKRPEITVSSADADKLYNLIESLPAYNMPGVAELEAELDRANIVSSADVPPSVVTMNSTVVFSVKSSAEEFELSLVYPEQSDASGKTISILAPVGSALLGLSKGDEIEWPKPGGGALIVTIKDVTFQPERDAVENQSV